MELLVELLKILVPSFLVFLTAWLIIKGFLMRETDTVKALLIRESERSDLQLRLRNKELTLPLRLQAYERMSLFCARIELGQLVWRVQDGEAFTGILKTMMIATIEEEFNHNVTQQMYMSEELWNLILLSKTEAINILVHVAKEVGDDKPAQAFLDGLSKYLAEEPQMGYIQAQKGIKKEVSMLF